MWVTHSRPHLPFWLVSHCCTSLPCPAPHCPAPTLTLKHIRRLSRAGLKGVPLTAALGNQKRSTASLPTEPAQWLLARDGAAAKDVHKMHFPAAMPSADGSTLAKFVTPHGEMCLSAEQYRIAVELPQPLMLIGRAGSGKTTMIVERLWRRWWAARQRGEEPPQQMFVTANKLLCESVRRFFNTLRCKVAGERESKAKPRGATADHRSPQPTSRRFAPEWRSQRGVALDRWCWYGAHWWQVPPRSSRSST